MYDVESELLLYYLTFIASLALSSLPVIAVTQVGEILQVGQLTRFGFRLSAGHNLYFIVRDLC